MDRCICIYMPLLLELCVDIWCVGVHIYMYMYICKLTYTHTDKRNAQHANWSTTCSPIGRHCNTCHTHTTPRRRSTPRTLRPARLDPLATHTYTARGSSQDDVCTCIESPHTDSWFALCQPSVRERGSSHDESRQEVDRVAGWVHRPVLPPNTVLLWLSLSLCQHQLPCWPLWLSFVTLYTSVTVLLWPSQSRQDLHMVNSSC